MATMSAAPAMTVAAATEPSSNRGTMTSLVTQRTAQDEATVASAKMVAPPTAIAKLPGCREISRRIIRRPRHRSRRFAPADGGAPDPPDPSPGASTTAGVTATHRFYQRVARMAPGLTPGLGGPGRTCHPVAVEHVDAGLLVLRLALGLTLAVHGYNKFFGGGRLPGTAAWFESMGVRPGFPNAVHGRRHRGRGRAGSGRRAADTALGRGGHRADAGGHHHHPLEERVLHLQARRGLGVLRDPRRGRVLDRHDRSR